MPKVWLRCAAATLLPLLPPFAGQLLPIQAQVRYGAILPTDTAWPEMPRESAPR